MAAKTLALSINASWNIINFRAGLIRGFQEAGYRVVALTPTDQHTALLAGLDVEHVPVEMDPRGTSPNRDLALLRRYRSLLGAVRPSAFLGFTIKPNIYGSMAAHRLGIPVVNNITGLGETFRGRNLVNRVVRSLYKRALRKSARIFFQNPEDQALFVSQGVVEEGITRLLPGSGVDLERFEPTSETAATSEPPTFLLVARLLGAKGIAEYVAAGRIVRQRFPDIRLQLLGLPQSGKGALDPDAVKRWADAGDVEFLGGTDDVRPFLAAADCIVLPTYYPEGTPRSLLEGAAMGRPLIASDIPGCRETIVEGVNGFLVPPRDVAALADRMMDIIAMPVDQRRQMGRASRALAEQKFDERFVLAAYLEALESLQSR